MLRNDLLYKLVAVATAITLWAYVQGERNPKVPRNISGLRLEVKNLAKGSVIASGTNEVAVALEGPKSAVDQIRKDRIHAYVDLAGRGPGTHNVSVQVELPKDAPPEVKATPIPSSVTMTLEAVTSRVMNIDVNYVSSPPWGYQLGEPKLSTRSAYVSGRSALVDRIRRLAVMIDPSSIRTPTRSIDSSFAVAALDANGNKVKGVTIDPDRIRVKLSLIRMPATKMVMVSPSFLGQPKFGYAVTRVTVRPDEVTLKGPPEVLHDVSTVTTEDVDIEGAVATITRDVLLRLPRGVEVEQGRAVRVIVRIEPRAAIPASDTRPNG